MMGGEYASSRNTFSSAANKMVVIYALVITILQPRNYFLNCGCFVPPHRASIRMNTASPHQGHVCHVVTTVFVRKFDSKNVRADS